MLASVAILMLTAVSTSFSDNKTMETVGIDINKLGIETAFTIFNKVLAQKKITRGKGVSKLNRLKRQGTTQCLVGWSPYNSHCYKVSDKTENWETAQQGCNNLSAYLVELDTREENVFVSNLLKGASVGTGAASPPENCFDPGFTAVMWIGLSDQLREGQFRWAHSGAELSYKNWAVSEPNNIYDNEDCVEIFTGPLTAVPDDWNDDDCLCNRAYVCEMETETTTNPTALFQVLTVTLIVIAVVIVVIVTAVVTFCVVRRCDPPSGHKDTLEVGDDVDRLASIKTQDLTPNNEEDSYQEVRTKKVSAEFVNDLPTYDDLNENRESVHMYQVMGRVATENEDYETPL